MYQFGFYLWIYGEYNDIQRCYQSLDLVINRACWQVRKTTFLLLYALTNGCCFENFLYSLSKNALATVADYFVVNKHTWNWWMTSLWYISTISIHFGPFQRCLHLIPIIDILEYTWEKHKTLQFWKFRMCRRGESQWKVLYIIIIFTTTLYFPVLFT